jgi:hypothetical protein
MGVTVQSGFIGKVSSWHSEAYVIVPDEIIEDAPINRLVLAFIFLAPLFWSAVLWSVLR